MSNKLCSNFTEAVNAFQEEPTHSNFETIVRSAFAINSEILEYLKQDLKMPIREKKGKLKFGSQTQPFDTVAENDMSRAVKNICGIVSRSP